MGVLGTMTVNFTANVSGLQSGVSSAQGTINSFASAASTALMGTGVAAIGAGVMATKMAGDFEAGMTSLVTGAGEAQSNIKMVGDGILGLATSTGTSTKQLTDGMYMIESAGFHGADGLKVLQAAAQGAKVGNADLGTVANAVTTEMTDFASSGLTASQATNTLVATVSNGKTTMQALGGALANILPTASAAGVSLTDTSAAMATMTGEGIPAAQAATYLRQTIMAIENPSSKAASAFKSMGLNSADVAAEMKVSLPGALEMITDAAGKKFPVGSSQYIAAISNMVGGTKSMQGILDLTGDHLNTFKGNVTNIAGAVKSGGDSINGWANVQQTFNFKLAQAGEVLETTGIKIGTLLLPAVGRLLGVLSSPGFQSFATTVGNLLVSAVNSLVNALNALIPIISNVVSFFQHNQAAMVALQGVLMIVAGVIGGILVQAFVAWTIATWAQVVATWALAGPYIIVGIIIAAVIFGIILAIQHWAQITAWFQGIWGAVSSWFMGVLGAIGSFFVGLWSGIASFFVGLWTGISSWFMGALGAIGGFFVGLWSGISSFFIGVWNGIISFLKQAWVFIVNVVKVGALLLLAVIFAPIIAIAALFIWLYSHNYYFKALVDAIVNFFKGCFTWLQGAWTTTVAWLVSLWNSVAAWASSAWSAVSDAVTGAVSAAVAWLQSAWQAASSWLSGVWQGIVSFAISLWQQVSSAIQSGFNAAIGFVQSIWQQISSFFVNAWSTYISGPLHTLWTNVSSVFSSAWSTYISGPISSLWSQLSNTVSGWAGMAVQWGTNLIQGFINGILGMLGAVGNAASQVASKVASFLGFHSPAKEGPGHEADVWSPNFVKMYSQGLEAGIPKIQAAMNKLAAPMAINLKASSMSYPNGASNSSSAVLAALAAGNNGNNNQPIENHIYIDGKEVTSRLGPHIANAIRTQGRRSK